MTSDDGEIRLMKILRDVPPPLDLIRQKKAFYLGDQEPTGTFLAVNLAECAMISGARRIELLVLSGGWTAVSADADWITPNLHGQKGASMESAFVKMIPLTGGRPNQIRFEVIVTAFSSGLSVKAGTQWTTIVGDPPPQEIRDHVERNEFAVVFKTQIDS